MKTLPYTADPDYNKNMANLALFMADQQRKITDDDDPDEFSPEAVFGDDIDALGRNFSDADNGL
jgi:hypothetical protein